MSAKTGPASIIRQIMRNTRKKYSTEEKIRIILEGLRGEVKQRWFEAPRGRDRFW